MYKQFKYQILLDDSVEKCDGNPQFTSIQPLPYNSINDNDVELMEGGLLWKYLEDLSKHEGSIRDFIAKNPYKI